MDELLFEFTDNERDLRDAFEIKRQVFVREQNVLDDLELDTYDKESFHMVVKVGERVIRYCQSSISACFSSEI